MKKNNKKGFTLVELLAVIVILAIILVIAIPKIMNTVYESKTSSMESTAKLAAKAVERAYEISLANGEDETLSRKGDCMDIANLDPNEYKSCKYEIDENEKAIVTIKGTSTGKFANIAVVEATSKEADATPFIIETLENTIKNLVGTESGITFTSGGLKKYTYDNDSTETTEAANIVKTDYRYYGANPNNYVKFSGSDELWKIIGIIDGKVKLMRAEAFKKDDGSILIMSWDSSDVEINKGYGINEWSQADVSTTLNNYYYGTSIECKYCNGQKQATCENSCNSYITKMPSVIKNMVDEKTLWHTATGDDSVIATKQIYAANAYKNEHGDINGKICLSTKTGCTDTVERTTEWTGAVGLMSLSDYGYATDNAICNEPIYNNYKDTCKANNWIYQTVGGNDLLTMTPATLSTNAGHTFTIGAVGSIRSSAGGVSGVVPTIFLKSNVYVDDGIGTSDEPYILIQK